MTTTAARAADDQARIFFLLLRLPPAGVVASAFGAGGIVPIGCFWAGSSGFCEGSSGGALCWGELASPYCRPAASFGRGSGVWPGGGRRTWGFARRRTWGFARRRTWGFALGRTWGFALRRAGTVVLGRPWVLRFSRIHGLSPCPDLAPRASAQARVRETAAHARLPATQPLH